MAYWAMMSLRHSAVRKVDIRCSTVDGRPWCGVMFVVRWRRAGQSLRLRLHSGLRQSGRLLRSWLVCGPAEAVPLTGLECRPRNYIFSPARRESVVTVRAGIPLMSR